MMDAAACAVAAGEAANPVETERKLEILHACCQLLPDGDPDVYIKLKSLITPFLWILRVFCHHLCLGVLSAGAAAARQVPRRARPLRTRPTRPSSGWKLLKQLPLLQLPQPVLPTVLVQPIDEPVTLVDCGSGSTRALFFTDDGLSHVSWEKSDWRGWTVTNVSLVLPIVALHSVGGEDTVVSRLYQICIKVPRFLENSSSS